MATGQHPQGIVTFVFTDIEGSSKTARRLAAMGLGLYETHLQNPQRERLWAAVKRHNGVEVSRAGDGHFLAFHTADDALAAMVEFQQSLADEPITYTAPDGSTHTVRVRVGVHTAVAQLAPKVDAERGGTVDYSGSDVNYAARIGGLGEGGQIILSDEARRRAGNIGAYTLHPWPGRFLKSFEDAPQDVYEILYRPGQLPREPGLRFFPEFYAGEQNRYIDRPDKEAEVLAHFRDTRRNDGRTARLVTLLADGGMGKTRLAVACAVRLAGAFEHGIYFVDLSNTDPTAEAVAGAIGQALGRSGADALPENLFQFLRGRSTLLVLDNFEAVKSRPAALYLARLVTETRGVCLLVTGRAAVGASDVEQLISLDDGMTDAEAVDLFVARARLKGNFKVDPTDAEAAQLRRINALTERIPLALELTAAWVELLSLKRIADDLEAIPLSKETGPPPDGFRADEQVTGGRHRSLERSLKWSYDLLGRHCGEAAQRVFAVCGLFAATFDATTVAAVTAVPSSDEELFRLQGHSLVRRADGDGDDETRYRLHRFTRNYAAHRLAERADADDVRRRFVRHYAALASESISRLNALAVLGLLDLEWPNATAAAGVAALLCDHQAAVDLALIHQFLIFRGLWSEAEQSCRRGFEAATATGNQQKVGVTLNNLGIVYRRQGRYDEAADAYGRSLAIQREFKDRVGEGQTLNNLGIVYQLQGRYDEAGDAYGRSLVIRQEFKDRVGEGQTLNNLGGVYRLQGRYDDAADAIARSLAIMREFKDRVGEGIMLDNLGLVYQNQGRYGEAADAHGRALEICREFKNRVGEGGTLNNLGLVYQHQGRYSDAADAYVRALEICREFKDRVGECGPLNNLGIVYEHQGRYDEAADAYGRNLAICREFKDRVGEGRTLNNLAGVFQLQGRYDEAVDAYGRSLAICREFKDRVGEGLTLENLTLLWEARGDPKQAVSFARQAVAALEGTQAVAALARARRTLARLEGGGPTGGGEGG